VRKTGKLASLAVCLVLVGGLAQGCGSTVIDNEKVANEVHDDLRDSLNVSIQSVTCPPDLPVKPHSRFVCVVDAAGGNRADAVLEVLNPEADVRLATVRRHGG
jgi:hypothetical protein